MPDYGLLLAISLFVILSLLICLFALDKIYPSWLKHWLNWRGKTTLVVAGRKGYEWTNFAEAERLAYIKKEVEKREAEAKRRGWNIYSTLTIEAYFIFLAKLLEVKEVVDTGRTYICVCGKFGVEHGRLLIDHQAPMEDILNFLKS